MAAFKNDGTVQYGSQVLTLTNPSGSPVAYVADNISVSRPSKSILRTNELDEPSGQVSYVGDVDTGSAQLQLASGTTVFPQRGATFTAKFLEAAGSSENWYIDSVSPAYDKGSETKVNVTFREVIA